MNFYVPTIGDSIYLLQPWTFTLHQEHRNEGLAKRMVECGDTVTHYHHYVRIRATKRIMRPSGWIGGGQVLHEAGHEREMYDNSGTGTIDFAYHGYSADDWEIIGTRQAPYKIFEWKDKQATVTLPIGTQLKIDRIYIKSTYRNFDSITFRIGSCPENKKLSKARFWVKLKDANKIVCDLYPVVDTEAAKLYAATNRFNHLEE